MYLNFFTNPDNKILDFLAFISLGFSIASGTLSSFKVLKFMSIGDLVDLILSKFIPSKNL